jgi:hypothetical protein
MAPLASSTRLLYQSSKLSDILSSPPASKQFRTCSFPINLLIPLNCVVRGKVHVPSEMGAEFGGLCIRFLPHSPQATALTPINLR